MRLAALFLIAVLALAQSTPHVMEGAGNHNLPAQLIGIDDLIAVSVYRSPELTRTVRVNSAGAITLPLLTGPVPAEGLMPVALAGAIAAALEREGILVAPIVEVTVAEYASRPISVMGAVRKPLTFQAVGRVTLLDALARAEGLAPEAAEEILVTLPGREDPLIRRIPVKRLIDEAAPELNLVLHGGEEIRVPEAGRVFVVGNVNKPGGFPMPDPADATVLKLIAMAEGLAPHSQSKAFIFRTAPDTGAQQEILIELAQIMKRKTPDVPLELNDILYIPDSAGKKTLDRIVTFGASTASGVLIWRR